MPLIMGSMGLTKLVSFQRGGGGIFHLGGHARGLCRYVKENLFTNFAKKSRLRRKWLSNLA